MTEKKMSVTMVGLGYIGLPLAALICDSGIRVKGYDVNSAVVDKINLGLCPIKEPGLPEKISEHSASGLLIADTNPKVSDIYIIAVPTPVDTEFTPNLGYLLRACRQIASHLKLNDLIIIESTCPVGTTEKVSYLLQTLRTDLRFPKQDNSESDVNIAYCPERILPGNALNELKKNDRILGGLTTKCTKKAKAFYEKIIYGQCVATNSRTAEMAKLAENSFRDINIAYANELSMACIELDVNVWELIKLTNMHPRVDILMPGPGVGGHCIAVDPWFLYNSVPKYSQMIKKAREVNDFKPIWVIERTKSLKTKNPEKKIICLGLTFKANVDDVRESPSMRIFEELKKIYSENEVVGFDPFLKVNKIKQINTITLDYIENANDIILLLVDHNEFLKICPKSKLLIDTKGIW
jgi:UDP-N-acetyl-D-mannosaminuronic acid dehydrogenase